MAEINSVDQYFLQKTSEVTYGLWNAILTTIGILISAFSIILTLSESVNSFLVVALITLCCLSLVLIIWNYLSAKLHYLKIGKQLSQSKTELSQQQKKDDLKKSYQKHKLTIYRENTALLLLLIEIVCIVWIIATLKPDT